MNMRTMIILVLTLFLVTNGCNAQTNKEKEMNYKIEIINLFRGRDNQKTTITDGQIKSERNIATGESSTYERNLTEKEKKKIKDFLKHFPLSDLKDKYIYGGVKDGTQMRFIIRIDNTAKTIFVANAYQKDLGNLVALIVPMLKEDYIGYNKEYVPWESK
jgi:hypothetical protein